MEKLLVVVFDTEKQAYEGLKALNKLDWEGSIAIHSECVVEKNPDGTISTKQLEGDVPIRTLAGTWLGTLIGLFAGPVGAAVGASAGLVAGMTADTYVAGVNAEFLMDVSEKLAPGKFAVAADVSEEWVTPVDIAMEPLGGTVFRSARSVVESEQHARHITELKNDIAQLQAEQARVQADRKARIQARIDELNEKLDSSLAQSRARTEAWQQETKAKITALKAKAAKATRDKLAVIDARIIEIEQRHDAQLAEMKRATAARLRQQADVLEKAAG
ncbi:MAG TPA: DUF1269 domain-containing protein [Candidatus Limnocylindrales bacterium]|jgi:uncharacterized membrane protein|nr:DUF1269 domain-containing protein [Candidatus Limnocylindrales bacterium]